QRIALTDRLDQLTVGCVTAELPDEGTAESLLGAPVALAADGRRGVVAPPLAAAVRVRRACDRAAGGAAVLEDLVVLAALLVGSWRRPARRGAGLRLGHAVPAASVEAQAQQEFVRGHAHAGQLRDRGSGVQAVLGDAVVAGERGVRRGGPLSVPGAEV